MRRLIVGLVIAASAALVPTWAFAGNQEVAEQIAASLRDSGQLHGYRIGVKYNDGTVWLKGQVLSQEQKDAAVRLAKKANGVNVVNFDNLVVISGNAVAGSDRPLQQIDGALAAEQVQRLIAQDTRVASTERPAPEKLVDPLPPVPAEKQATVVPATDPTPAKHPGLAERLADSFPAQAVQQVKPTASPELASACVAREPAGPADAGTSGVSATDSKSADGRPRDRRSVDGSERSADCDRVYASAQPGTQPGTHSVARSGGERHASADGPALQCSARPRSYGCGSHGGWTTSHGFSPYSVRPAEFAELCVAELFALPELCIYHLSKAVFTGRLAVYWTVLSLSASSARMEESDVGMA